MVNLSIFAVVAVLRPVRGLLVPGYVIAAPCALRHRRGERDDKIVSRMRLEPVAAPVCYSAGLIVLYCLR